MKIRLLEVAQIKLNEAVEYYNSESYGLGDDFSRCAQSHKTD